MLRVGRRRDDDDHEVALDGESVSCPMFLMDSTQRAVFDASLHAPGFRLADTAVRDARKQARDEYVRRLCDAWKRPARDTEPEAAFRSPDEIDPNERLLRGHFTGAGESENEENQAKRDRAWRRYKDELSNAWRNPGVTDPSRANEVERLRRRTVTNEI